MAHPSRFWDRHAKGYAKRPVADQEAYGRKLKKTQEYLRPDMRVLEFACGTGTTALIHAPYVEHISAVDISRKMLEIAKAKAAADDVENVTFSQSSIEAFDGEDASYDAVMAHSILHLLEEKEAAIDKSFRLLKPGGFFISSTVCLGGQLPLLRPLLPIGRFFGLLPLVAFFTQDELIGAVADAGFDIEHQWYPEKGRALFLIARKP